MSDGNGKIAPAELRAFLDELDTDHRRRHGIPEEDLAGLPAVIAHGVDALLEQLRARRVKITEIYTDQGGHPHRRLQLNGRRPEILT